MIDLPQGGSGFVDSIRLPGAVEVAFVRSTIAHAEIDEVDVEEAREIPGVVGIWTAADLSPNTDLPAGHVDSPEGLMVDPPVRPLLAREQVRFVGEPVAVIAAENRYAAADAAGMVIVEYEPLDSVASIGEALSSDSATIHKDIGSNVVLDLEKPHGPAPPATVRRAMSTWIQRRRAPAPALPVVAAARWKEKELELWSSSSDPEATHAAVRAIFDVAEEDFTFVHTGLPPSGSCTEVAPEVLVTAYIAQHLGRPATYTQSRSESLLAMPHVQAHEAELTVDFDDDGVIHSFDVNLVADSGAWPTVSSLDAVCETVRDVGALYGIPAVGGRVRSVVTTTTPVSGSRATARAAGDTLVEAALDLVATECSVDPVEIRRRNLDRASGSGDNETALRGRALLDRCLAILADGEMSGAATDESRHRGLGIALRRGRNPEELAAEGCTVVVVPGREVEVERACFVGPVSQRAAGDGLARGVTALGVARAQYEEMRYDEDGQPQTSTFVDYLVPSAADSPPIDVAATGPGGDPDSWAASEAAAVSGVTAALTSHVAAGVRVPFSSEELWRSYAGRSAEGLAP
ncbi:MAG: molybdopterin-dependent oxidoreductase [Acidimicrobiia bacterium]|nr:molybdopterin-dependent oxidoreductase [Acidimicrobiia bacterium]